MEPKPIPGFDCVEFKRRSQERIYEQIKGMTAAEEIEYFRHAAETGPFKELIKVSQVTMNASTGEEIRFGTDEVQCKSMPLLLRLNLSPPVSLRTVMRTRMNSTITVSPKVGESFDYKPAGSAGFRVTMLDIPNDREVIALMVPIG